MLSLLVLSLLVLSLIVLSLIVLSLFICTGTIKEDCGDSTYYVEDSVGVVERIIRQDIISDEDDASNNISVSIYVYEYINV